MTFNEKKDQWNTSDPPDKIHDPPPLPMGHFIFTPPVHHQKISDPPEYNRPPAGNKWLFPYINSDCHLLTVYAMAKQRAYQCCSGVEETAFNNWRASWASKAYHQTIGTILEAETGVQGSIKNEILRLVDLHSLMECLHRWSDGSTHTMEDIVLYWTSLK